MLTQRLSSSNVLNIWGNKDSMNMNSMILTNIQASTYFKKDLYELKTYHEVIDEIYYRVKHLEPWEKGSRRTQGLHGMCGGVRGVGGGGIVSTAFCILFKLYTLKLTRKQVLGLMNHQDSVFIRGLGFMYVRYTQQPQDLYAWFEPYLDDTEEIDVKAGGGCMMTIGAMLRQWLTRLEWFDTLFPRIPAQIQSEIMARLTSIYGDALGVPNGGGKKMVTDEREIDRSRSKSRSRSKGRRSRSLSGGDDGRDGRSRSHKKHHRKGSRHRSRTRSRSKSRSRSRTRSRSYDRERDREKKKHKSHKHHRHHHHRDGSAERRRSGSRKRDRTSRSRSRSRSKATGEKKKRRDSS